MVILDVACTYQHFYVSDRLLMNFKERDMNIFFSFVCAFARSTRSGVVCSSHKFMVWRNISYFLMFHCWSSQHCRLLISYFFLYFFYCVFEQEKKGKNKENAYTTHRKLLTSLFETDDVSDEDVWLLLFAFEADTIKVQLVESDWNWFDFWCYGKCIKNV